MIRNDRNVTVSVAPASQSISIFLAAMGTMMLFAKTIYSSDLSSYVSNVKSALQTNSTALLSNTQRP